MPSGGPPAGKGEPPTAVRLPSPAIVKTVTSFDPAFPAIRNLPSGVAANEIPLVLQSPPEPPFGKRPTRDKAPVVGLMEKALTSLLPLLEANRKFLTVPTVTRFDA